jgi:hypothetical protein
LGDLATCRVDVEVHVQSIASGFGSRRRVGE